jgi:hypothetical protein
VEGNGIFEMHNAWRDQAHVGGDRLVWRKLMEARGRLQNKKAELKEALAKKPEPVHQHSESTSALAGVFAGCPCDM